MKVNEWDVILSASRDPYNTTEKMVMVWEHVNFQWTNGRHQVIDFRSDSNGSDRF